MEHFVLAFPLQAGFGEVVGHLGLVPNLAALVWAAYGGYLIASKMKNGKGNSHGAVAAALDQLRRDLEKQHDLTRKDNRNAMTSLLLELELFVKTGTRRRAIGDNDG